MRSLTTLLACLGVLGPITQAVTPVEVREQQFVNSETGNRFMVLGVDYQPGGQGSYGTGGGDPLSNATICLRDAALMQALGVNTIRSYNLDPSLNHDECASIFNSIGIYMILDVNSPLPGESLDRSDPSGSYTTSYLERVFALIEAFKSYPNTLGYFAANEVINDIGSAADNPPYMRAIQRDMKNYIANNADRQIPVGYSAADVREVLEDTWAYLSCDNSDNNGDDMSRMDFFGLNSYSWCNGGSFETSTYGDLVSIFSNTTVPVFFSEYGCNEVTPRDFEEVQAIYGPEMTVMSGGLIYEWTQEESNYGIIDAFENGTARLRPDYDTLNGQYSQLNLTLLEARNDTATSLQPPRCGANLISNDGFSTDFDIPPPPDGAQDLIDNGIENAPTGTIVDVETTTVPVAVYGTNGGELQNLAISPGADGANNPGSGGDLQTSEPSPDGGNGGDSEGDPPPEDIAATINTGVFGSTFGAVALVMMAFAL